MDFEESLKLFRTDIPALGLLGHPKLIDSTIPYCIDKDVQLVCKYLKAYKYGNINREYKEGKEVIPGYGRILITLYKEILTCFFTYRWPSSKV